jgi:poly(3-hydroxyalkanoate) depolymerase
MYSNSAHNTMNVHVKPSASLQIRMMEAGGYEIRVGVRPGNRERPPVLMFNGIGANLELARPFLDAFDDVEAIIFDVPGVGGSPLPRLPYRPSTLANVAKDLLQKLGHARADVTGVSWGGGLAQQFAHQHPALCRKLVLVATSAGAIMVPGSISVLSKMASPRRYIDKGYMREIASEIYGGDFRKDPTLIHEHAENMKPTSQAGYILQLLAMTGWTSVPWLWSLKQPTLILAGTDDPLVPVINARFLNAMIPNSRLELVDNGHLFVVTRPKETAEIVDAFLREP